MKNKKKFNKKKNLEHKNQIYLFNKEKKKNTRDELSQS